MKGILETTTEKDGFTYSFDKQRIDTETVHDFLARRSYWALGIDVEVVRESIAHSICLGVYDADNRMAGFGRMITDRATFGYLADVFVLEDFRGRGISRQMMQLFCGLAEAFRLRRFLLTTQDAHGLYAQCGFRPFPWPERLMLYTGQGAPEQLTG